MSWTPRFTVNDCIDWDGRKNLCIKKININPDGLGGTYDFDVGRSNWGPSVDNGEIADIDFPDTIAPARLLPIKGVSPENMVVGKEYPFTINNARVPQHIWFYKYAYRKLSDEELDALMHTKTIRLIGKMESLSVVEGYPCVSMTRVRLALLENDRKRDDLLHDKQTYDYEEYNPSTIRRFCKPYVWFYEYISDDIIDSRTRQTALEAAMNALSTDPNKPRLPQYDLKHLADGWLAPPRRPPPGGGGKRRSKRRHVKKRRSRKRRQSRRKN